MDVQAVMVKFKQAVRQSVLPVRMAIIWITVLLLAIVSVRDSISI